MRVFITGAVGRVGSAVATHLQTVGHDIVATDAVYRRELPFKLHLADLCDHRAVYPLVDGCDAVIQLGNHPNMRATRPPQKLLAENVAMNTNVFTAAYDVGVRRIIGISSVQATAGVHGSKLWQPDPQPCRWPHFPVDGHLPRNPGNNAYALSKVFAEQTLEAMAEEYDDLAAAMVRLPFVLHAHKPKWQKHDRPLKIGDHRLIEGTCYVTTEDTCTALQAMVEQLQPGYRQYFVGQSLVVAGMTLQDMVARYFPQQRVVGPLGGDGGLVDLSRLKTDFGWSPARPPIEVEPAAPADHAT